ncbi:MAG: biotin carboxylase [Proteobacteria bacterium]|nr:biotin carboxylase [Pseudomonadota bacterium]
MFDRILIANRGEIARRVSRTCRRLGIETVAVHSDADADALFVREMDAAVRIGEAPVAASYLKVDAILEAARQTGAQAVHPGYGLLSENAAFARAVTDAGLVWIGPPAEVIDLMGDKLRSRQLATSADVPVLPASGSVSIDDPDALEAAGAAVGFPLLVKLSAGGGGIGMTRVEEPGKPLRKALKKAVRRGESAFGDSTAYLERAVDRPRHVEVQVLSDAHGAHLHLLERDCSMQRRHQKVVEEAPAPGLSDELRQALWGAATKLARAVGYRSAGTVEFLVDGDDYYFLEMNTRIQVEHPVTEQITGIDLIEQQLRIAAGEALAFGQDDIAGAGHAIELRLYAEDPIRHMPQPGTIERWEPPTGEGLRVDHALETGADVTPFYDPMLAKIIAHGPDRATALARAAAAVDSLVLDGLTHNAPLHRAILSDDAFAAGDVHTGLLADVVAAMVAD